MWFKKQKDFVDLLKPIEEVRPLIQDQLEKSGRLIDKAGYSMLHDRYVLTLKEIETGMKFPKKPVSMRVIESDKNGHIAIHDVSTNAQKPNLFKTSLGQKKFLNFQNAIAKIKTKHKDEAVGEIRVLHVPALNAEALWLHFDSNDNNDKFALTVEFDPKDKELLTKKEFVDFLINRKNALGEVKHLEGG